MGSSIDPTETVAAVLRRHIADARSGWGCGSFGAIAEFVRVADEPVCIGDDDRITAFTDRGGIRIDPIKQLRPIAYEMTSRDPEAWQHGLALCLPEDDCAMSRHTVVTELGPDHEALRPQDRSAILFDLGLDQPQIDVCVRSADPHTIERLRAGVGRPFLEHGGTLYFEMAKLSPHRVFQCRFGRVEVYQPIPLPDGKSPDGPHTHVLPKLLAHRRTHAANLPIPAGWIPCMTLFPPNPVRDELGRLQEFDAGAYASFQELWNQFGDSGLVALKEAVKRFAIAGRESLPDLPLADTREGRATIQVALRQLGHVYSSLPTISALKGRLDRDPVRDTAHDA
jgi:hypothetical protein